MKANPIIAIITMTIISLILLLMLDANDYDNLVEKHNNLVNHYNEKTSEISELKTEIKDFQVLIKDYQRNQFDLQKEVIDQKESMKILTTGFQKKDKELSDVYAEYWSSNNFTWTGCKDERTVLKFCKGCNWDLVCSSSMRPTYSCENTLYFCSANKDEIKKGDIIAFISPEYTNNNYDNFYTIHRVINITDKGYVTKGDNNLYVDEVITPYKNIRGKLWRIDG